MAEPELTTLSARQLVRLLARALAEVLDEDDRLRPQNADAERSEPVFLYTSRCVISMTDDTARDEASGEEIPLREAAYDLLRCLAASDRRMSSSELARAMGEMSGTHLSPATIRDVVEHIRERLGLQNGELIASSGGRPRRGVCRSGFAGDGSGDRILSRGVVAHDRGGRP